jgi:formamidopyrimidine-DNA glycosylase
MLEVEAYRRLAEAAVGRTVAAVAAPDGWYLKGGLTPRALRAALRGRVVSGARRIGKLLLVDTDGGAGPVLGLRFGMTGKLLVDGVAGVEELRWDSSHRVPVAVPHRWDRLVLRFDGGGDLRVRDMRRLGGVELDPDESRLGPDAASVGLADLVRVLAGSEAPLKARLMDQSRVAGLGNLLVDELLWRAGLDPARPAGRLTPAEQRRLFRHLRATLAELGERGGSHTGDLDAERRRDGACPRDGTPLLRRTVGGRTTFSCPTHQR